MHEVLYEDLRRYSTVPVSLIASHQGTCCLSARLRLTTAIDRGSVETSLAAIPSVVVWDAVEWPAHWCALVRDEDEFVGDCGVHAALAALVLARHGIDHARAQIAIAAGGQRSEHWRARWLSAGVRPDWIGDSSVYHEVIRVQDRYWDPSEARWFDGAGSWLVSGRVAACRDFSGQWATGPTVWPHGSLEPARDGAS